MRGLKLEVAQRIGGDASPLPEEDLPPAGDLVEGGAESVAQGARARMRAAADSRPTATRRRFVAAQKSATQGIRLRPAPAEARPRPRAASGKLIGGDFRASGYPFTAWLPL